MSIDCMFAMMKLTKQVSSLFCCKIITRYLHSNRPFLFLKKTKRGFVLYQQATRHQISFHPFFSDNYDIKFLCQLFHFWGQPDKKDWGQADHCTAQQWVFIFILNSKLKFKKKKKKSFIHYWSLFIWLLISFFHFLWR